jgi:hypothetical protein
MKIANKIMMGSGIPINQSKSPRPNPMTSSTMILFVVETTAASLQGSVLCRRIGRLARSEGGISGPVALDQ